MMKKLLVFSLSLFFMCCAHGDIISQNISGGCNSTVLSGFAGEAYLFPEFVISTYNCNEGYYLPADTLGCVQCPASGYDCPGGTYEYNYITDQGKSYKKLISENVVNGCKYDLLYSDNKNASLEPVFVKNEYSCSPGYYLPADSVECVRCVTDHYCTGGTYAFDETINQGIVSCPNNKPYAAAGMWQESQCGNCPAGYYLPANVNEYTKCLNDHYCPGGNVTFDANSPQGIIPCPSTHPYAPAGMWEANQCGRKMHLGNDVIYLHQSPANPTEHRFFTGYNNGTNYSANMVLRDTGSSTFPKMSVGAANGLHVTINGAEYLVCDDSVPECRNEQ